jgi:predicted 3-demethylubiquinone-9 3-methyltransferase (glyoxalase superfamily)
MKNNIYPCLWFNSNAKEAATFYCTVFNNSKVVTDNGIVVMFELEGKKIMGLNGGPMFSINPSISFFVTCESLVEIESIWTKLIAEGSAMMPLDKYPWAEKYGWVKDKYGMTWQLMLADLKEGEQKIKPSFLFVGEQYGKAEAAMQHYSSVFSHSHIHTIELYVTGEPQPEGNLKFGEFSIGNQFFVAMDGFGNHEFAFSEGFSLVVECDTQEEINTYWQRLTEGGVESQCGWLKDKYGVSWQIVPTTLSKLMDDKEKAPRVIQAFLKMKKFDIEGLVNA